MSELEKLEKNLATIRKSIEIHKTKKDAKEEYFDILLKAEQMVLSKMKKEGATEAPVKKESSQKPKESKTKKTPKPKAAPKPVKLPEMSMQQADKTTYSEGLKFIIKFLNIVAAIENNKKTKTRKTYGRLNLLNLLKAIQKARVSLVIRKDDPFAKEINSLIKLLSDFANSGQESVSFSDENKEKLFGIADSFVKRSKTPISTFLNTMLNTTQKQVSANTLNRLKALYEA